MERTLLERDFPILIGIDMDGIDQSALVPQQGSMIRTDTLVRATIPPEALTLLMVPDDQTDIAQSAVNGSGTKVISLERYRAAMYDPYRPRT